MNQRNDSGTRSGQRHNVEVVGQVELAGVTDLSQCGSAGFPRCSIHRNKTVLPDVHADAFRVCDVGVGVLQGGAGAPHVEEKVNGDRREAEDGEEGQEEDVGQEHELQKAKDREVSCLFPNSIKYSSV